MTEFQPGDGPAVPAPADAYGRPAPAAPEYLTVVMPPASGAAPQAAPQAYPQPYAQPAPQPYAQPAPQPYAQPAPQPYAQQAQWGAPAAAWAPPVSKKRKVWPWVVGSIGFLVVLGGATAALGFGLWGSLNADQNDNYTGAPISASDEPTVGDALLVSDDGRVAFEMESTWVEAANYMDVSGFAFDGPNAPETIAVYFTSDPTTAIEIPSLVSVMMGDPARDLGSTDVEASHNEFLDGLKSGAHEIGIEPDIGDTTAITTANGLDGLTAVVTMQSGGMEIRQQVFTFARSGCVVSAQVTTYTGQEDTATNSLVLETLRIDK